MSNAPDQPATTWREDRAGIVLAMLASAAVLAATLAAGIETTADSANYLAASRSLVHDATLQTYDGLPFVSWPPLYPVLLVPGSLPGVDVGIYASLTAAALVAGLVLAVARETRALSASPSARLLAALLVATSPLVMRVAVALWSELPFLVVSALAIGALARVLEVPSTRRVAVAALLLGALCLLRYAGAVACGLGVVVVGIACRRNVRAALVRVALFASLSLLPLALWLVRNLALSGTMFGERLSGARVIGEDAASVLRQLLGTVVPARVVGGLPTWVLAIGVCLGLLTLLVGLVQSRRGAAPTRALAWVSVAYGLLYVLALVVAARTAMDPIDKRLLAPLAVPLAYLGAWAWDEFHTAAPPLTGLVVVVVVVALQARTSTGVLATFLAHQRLETSHAGASATLGFLRQVPSTVPVFSNDPPRAYLATGRRVGWIPRLRHYQSEQAALPDDLRVLRSAISKNGRALLIWFRAAETPWVAGPRVLSPHVSLRLVGDLPDGLVYEAAF